MTNIDDSQSTTPGPLLAVIEHRMRERTREELREQGLRPGGWRILRALA